MIIYDFFLCSGLRQKNCLLRNNELINILNLHGFKVYAPQSEMPLNSHFTAIDIFEGNVTAIESSKNILFIPNNAGEGVFFEIGYALGKNKRIIGYSDSRELNYGKIFNGFWETIALKAYSIEDLDKILINIK
jgi:nucleoside 2-deoxyribosyltransferase